MPTETNRVGTVISRALTHKRDILLTKLQPRTESGTMPERRPQASDWHQGTSTPKAKLELTVIEHMTQIEDDPERIMP